MSVNASSDDHNQSKWKVPCGALRAPYGRGNACDPGAAGGGSSLCANVRTFRRGAM